MSSCLVDRLNWNLCRHGVLLEEVIGAMAVVEIERKVGVGPFGILPLMLHL